VLFSVCVSGGGGGNDGGGSGGGTIVEELLQTRNYFINFIFIYLFILGLTNYATHNFDHITSNYSVIMTKC
jgi:hypothetical protein